MSRTGEKRIPRRSLEDTRRLVVHAVEQGMHPDEAAGIFDVGRSTVYNWMKEFRENGTAAFTVKKATGRPRKLSGQQMVQLRSIIIGREPRQLQLDFALWTRELVREIIRRKFGVTYTLPAVGTILRDLGLSPQRPLVRAYEQNPELVRRWKEEEYPAIHAAAKTAGASVLFCDESGVRTDYHSGTTWAPVGQTPIIRGTGNRKTVNMISAVSPRGKLHFSFVGGNVNAANFITYLKELMHDIPGPIFLIVDGHPAHTAKATKEFVQSTEGRLSLYFLPPYSPELNPDEWVWKSIKYDWVGKMAARTADEMREGIRKAVSRLQSSAEIIMSFLHDPDLSYIASCVQ
jgi:transposase